MTGREVRATLERLQGSSRFRLTYTPDDGQRTVTVEVPNRLLPLALQLDLRPRIEVRATLDEGGRVVRVEGLSGPAHPERGPTARPEPRGARPSAGAPTGGDGFINPYNFVPVPPRPSAGPLADAGEGAPGGHDRYLPEAWSGRLEVELTTVTPLVLADGARASEAEGEHRREPVRLDGQGRPLLATTSVKGMLRAAYEAVTNSRFGVLAAHDRPVAFRQVASQGLETVPVRLVRRGGELRAQPMLGLAPMGSQGAGRPMKEIEMHAAWVPCYEPDDEGGRRRRGEERYREFTHGDRVHARISSQRKGFRYWRVEEMVPFDQPRPVPRSDSETVVTGFFVRCHRTNQAKRYERLFFNPDGAEPPPLPLAEGVERRWRQLIEDYQEQHRRERERRRRQGRGCRDHRVDPGTGELAEAAIPRHACDESALELKEGTLAYARIKDNRVTDLFPVMISRELHPRAPAELVPEEVRPARGPAELSPADRVFGTVHQAGRLRFSRIALRTPVERALRRIEGGLPLAVLSAPKKAQARFYLAQDRSGTPLPDGVEKQKVGYRDGRWIRGRKVYLFGERALGRSYWDPERALAEGGGDREYVRPGLTRDDQNRTIEGWVEPGTVFEFSIEFTNLSTVELGALLWLLSDQVPYHRLGLGKPLGLGVVRLRERSEVRVIRDGEGWAEWYADLEAGEPGSATDLPDFVGEYRRAVAEAYGGGEGFESVPFVRAFLRASRPQRGHDVHYPRVRGRSEEGFEWFVQNERMEKGRVLFGRGRSLPALHGQGSIALPSWGERTPRPGSDGPRGRKWVPGSAGGGGRRSRPGDAGRGPGRR
ncbi:MAG TPA: TIGR03986 family CRISPR-associated RAMP protein [Candidatus Dormibacteraeota bacterium]|nr:TIGR03986 family CRISPR-associated RAMP protein [Candidatus Dormibacteraeota bacterium]